MSQSTDWVKIGAIAGVVGAGVAILFGVLNLNVDDSPKTDTTQGAAARTETSITTGNEAGNPAFSSSTTSAGRSATTPITSTDAAPTTTTQAPTTTTTSTTTTTQAPTAVLLTDLEPAEGGLSSGSVDLGGETYRDSIYKRPCYLACDDFWIAGYNLGKDYSLFTTTVGAGDDSDSDAAFLMEIYLDGVRAYSQVVTLGYAEQVELDVTGVLRLELRIEPDNGYGPATFGNPTLSPLA